MPSCDPVLTKGEGLKWDPNWLLASPLKNTPLYNRVQWARWSYSIVHHAGQLIKMESYSKCIVGPAARHFNWLIVRCKFVKSKPVHLVVSLGFHLVFRWNVHGSFNQINYTMTTTCLCYLIPFILKSYHFLKKFCCFYVYFTTTRTDRKSLHMSIWYGWAKNEKTINEVAYYPCW